MDTNMYVVAVLLYGFMPLGYKISNKWLKNGVFAIAYISLFLAATHDLNYMYGTSLFGWFAGAEIKTLRSK